MAIPVYEIDSGMTLEQWTFANKDIIHEAIYTNIFKFSKQKTARKVILRVKSKAKSKISRNLRNSFSAEITLVRTGLYDTVCKLLTHYTNTEQYEKCDSLLILKTQLENESK
jgi:hypothetical protein